MGSATVIIVSVVIIVLILFTLRMIGRGGPALPVQAIEPWDWGLTTVGPIDCMGFVDGPNKLITQVHQVAVDGRNGIPSIQTVEGGLPATWYMRPGKDFDKNGEIVKDYSIPRMGTPAYVRAWKDSDGNIRTKDVERVPGTHKDCCTYLMDHGRLGAAIYDPNEQLCYVYDFMSPRGGANFATGSKLDTTAKPVWNADDITVADIGNVFPLLGYPDGTSPPVMQNVSQMSDPPEKGKFLYMMNCGGQGMPPCDYHSGKPANQPAYSGDKEFTQAWPPKRDGCSQTGGGTKGGPPTITLQRTPVSTSLPFSDTRKWEICETMSYIDNMSYIPKNPDRCKKDYSCLLDTDRWQWSPKFPQFDPSKPVSAPYDPNTSLARFLYPPPLQQF